MLRGVLLLAFGALTAISAAAIAAAEGRIEIAGAPEVVFDWTRDHCPPDPSDPEGWDMPDSPPRAIRTADMVRLFAVHFTNLALVGSADMARFRHPDCRTMMSSAKNPDPARFADYEWIVSPYTLDGRRVFALVHEEFHGWLYDKACGARYRTGWRDCSYFSTTSAVSEDGGATFERTGNDTRLIAAPTERFSPQMTSGGIGDPTNVVRNPRDGRFYFLARAMAFASQPVGICLFRAKALEPGAWRAWDGKGFSIRWANPYQSSPRPCAPVLPTSDVQYSVTYNTVLARFVLLGRNDSEVFYRLSEDLIRWSPRRHLLGLPLLNANKERPVSLASYYSLLDPSSPSGNFDVSGAQPYLYFVQWHVREGRLVNSERDIIRSRLRVTG